MKSFAKILMFLILVLSFSGSVFAGSLVKPYTFTSGTPAKASEVNANFDAVYNAVNALIDGWVDAGETWSFSGTNSPEFTFAVAGDKTGKYSPGMRLKLTQASIKYFIVTRVVYSSPNTIVTVFGGTDYTLDSSAITNPKYSVMKAPVGFSLDPTKWTVQLTNNSGLTQSNPVVGAWYNLGSLSLKIPTGAWIVSFKVIAQTWENQGDEAMSVALSTSSNSISDSDFQTATSIGLATGNIRYHIYTIFMEKPVSLSSATTYYLIAGITVSGISPINFRGDGGATVIRAVCAYL